MVNLRTTIIKRFWRLAHHLEIAEESDYDFLYIKWVSCYEVLFRHLVFRLLSFIISTGLNALDCFNFSIFSIKIHVH